MAIRLKFSIDNPINPEDLLTLVLQEPEMKLPQDTPRQRRNAPDGRPPIVETHIVLPAIDFWLIVYGTDEMWREGTYETMQIAPRVGFTINYGVEVSDDEFLGLFAYVLRSLEGDALLTFDGASPILRRKDGVILINAGGGYYNKEPFRSMLPPPVQEGKIPW
jgi:hypothetical protein